MINQPDFVFASLRPTNKFVCVALKNKKMSINRHLLASFYFCGKRGIRTPGASQLIGFQDRRIRPLCHLSGDKGTTFFLFCKIFREKLKFCTIFCNFVGWNNSLLLKEQCKKSPSERFTRQEAISSTLKRGGNQGQLINKRPSQGRKSEAMRLFLR